ncbi:hypothetical protein B0H10DRAFT_2304127 [Mycena sp. CBHHK59/15]|nr:hypothetical protein B0H10DRAFT_2304127 [Mycena sp. CBHHK59/15]
MGSIELEDYFQQISQQELCREPFQLFRNEVPGILAESGQRDATRLIALATVSPRPKLLIVHVSAYILATLQYDDDYWQSKFLQGQLKGLTLETRLHLVFSLMIFLSISTRQLIYWLFTTEIPCVTKRISHFMGFFATESTPESQFAPAMLFGLWRDGKRWPKAQKHLREMAIPCAHELALQDSDRVISSPLLHIQLETLTIRELRDLLHPKEIIEIIKGLAPFTWGILHTFCASPNRSRKQQKKNEDEPMPPSGTTEEEEEDWMDDPNDDPNVEAGESDPSAAPKRGCVMVINGFTLYSQLFGWQPTLEDIQAIAFTISSDFATATAAKLAQDAGDDWMAHSIYFIRDSLFFCMFEKAVSFADAGWLLRVLKYWGLAFRGVGQHNYARECAEVLIRWRYELPAKLRRALERSWFVNRWGIIGRAIGADLYLEQFNFWVKRVYIASGAGVTVEYMTWIMPLRGGS